MRGVFKAVILLIVVAVVLVWVGLRVSPSATPPTRRPSRFEQRATLHDGLPAGLQYYLTQTVGRTPLVANTALAWGTARLRTEVGGFELWLPVAWQEAIDVHRGFVWRGEVRWWGWTIAEFEERWVDGRGSRMLGDSLIGGQCVDRSQAMRAHAEFAWLPSALVEPSPGQNRAWRSLGTWRAVMRYSGRSGADSLVVAFDSHSRALRYLAGMRCQDDSVSRQWTVEFSEWDSPGGLTIPVEGQFTRDAEPYYEFRIDGIAYNVPVGDWLGPPPGR